MRTHGAWSRPEESFFDRLVNDPAACCHPLNVSGSDDAAIADTVAVLHRSSQNIGNRLNTAMRMPWKAGQIIGRNIVTEIVKQQERVIVRSIVEAERATQMHSRALQGRLG